MNAVAEVHMAVSVALLGPADAAREQLRQALLGLGADLVFEGEVRQSGALVGRAPQVLIVNLEPGVEDDLDALQDLLDSPDTSVVFNEGEVSSQLTGWDLARWARHLAAKVLGVRDTLPPPPSGAERLPELSVLPEPGRPISPSQQQDHLRFDDFAEEALGHSAEVPASPRLDLAAQAPESDFDGLDFDFSPVEAAEPATPASAAAPRSHEEADALESMELSALFEQDLSQVSPDDMLLKLQQAMGLDPAPIAAPARASSPSASPATETSTARVAPESFSAEAVAARPRTVEPALAPADQAAGGAEDIELATLDLGAFEVDPSAFETIEATETVLETPPAAPDPAASDSASVEVTDTGFSFDPVAFESELSTDLTVSPGDASELETLPRANDESDSLELEAFDFSAFDVAVAPAPEASQPEPLARFDAEDASLGGTLTLESAIDDEEVARLAAALDEQPERPAPVDLPPLDFDLPRDRGSESIEPAPSRVPEPAPRVQAAPEASPAPRKSFGELSLQPLDDGFIDPGVKAPETPAKNFDFSHLSLSLEPIEVESPAPAAGVAVEAAPGSMREGAWLRDLHEMPQQAAPAATATAQADEEAAAAPSTEVLEEDLSAGFDFTPGGSSPPPIPAAAVPAVAPTPLAGSISRVIVLCASIGGPDALRSFLAEIPPGFPALFVVVQHLENGYFERLAQQLQKASRLPVRVPMAGLAARDGEVLVVASGARFQLTAEGAVELGEANPGTRYRPCIDDVLHDVADTFGPHAHAVIFSGMAADAVEGSVYLNQQGGLVWAQDPETCVVSSMVDGARARGVVDYVGSPAELARRCVQRYA